MTSISLDGLTRLCCRRSRISANRPRALMTSIFTFPAITPWCRCPPSRADRHDDVGPDILQRYNMFRTAEINGANGPGISTGQALEIMDGLAKKDLPGGYGYEWTSIAYQEKEAGGTQGPIFGMAMVFVFLVLAAQYESWAVPFSVLLGLPICVLGAFIGVTMAGLENNVYVQIGIVALMGLAAKNAILIFEFAKEYHEKKGLRPPL